MPTCPGHVKAVNKLNAMTSIGAKYGSGPGSRHDTSLTLRGNDHMLELLVITSRMETNQSKLYCSFRLLGDREWRLNETDKCSCTVLAYQNIINPAEQIRVANFLKPLQQVRFGLVNVKRHNMVNVQSLLWKHDEILPNDVLYDSERPSFSSDVVVVVVVMLLMLL